jgi:hypothetical protein
MHNTMLYIQRQQGRKRETVDECNTRSEATFLVSEYRLAEPNVKYYISRRACKEWNER